MVAGRHSVPDLRVRRPATVGRGSAGATRRRVGGRRAVRDHRGLQRRADQPDRQRGGRRLHPGQDPIDRERSRDGRRALPERSPLRHQATVSRHQLLRHVQPAARPPRRPAQAPDRDDHRERHRHRRRSIRVRRHRVRHRFRRDDGRPRLRRHHRTRRRDAEGEVGPRAHHLPRPHHGRVPELLHDHRPGQPVGAVEHDGVDRAARRLGRRLPRRHARARRHHDRAHRDGGSRLGAARERLRRHHPLPHRQLVVHGRQRARQAAGVPALRRRRRCVPGGVRRGRWATTTSGSASPAPTGHAATTAWCAGSSPT